MMDRTGHARARKADSLVNQIVCRCHRQKVCLTGDGADEVFGGYGRALRYDSQASDVFHELKDNGVNWTIR